MTVVGIDAMVWWIGVFVIVLHVMHGAGLFVVLIYLLGHPYTIGLFVD